MRELVERDFKYCSYFQLSAYHCTPSSNWSCDFESGNGGCWDVDEDGEGFRVRPGVVSTIKYKMKSGAPSESEDDDSSSLSSLSSSSSSRDGVSEDENEDVSDADGENTSAEQDDTENINNPNEETSTKQNETKNINNPSKNTSTKQNKTKNINNPSKNKTTKQNRPKNISDSNKTTSKQDTNTAATTSQEEMNLHGYTTSRKRTWDFSSAGEGREVGDKLGEAVGAIVSWKNHLGAFLPSVKVPKSRGQLCSAVTMNGNAVAIPIKSLIILHKGQEYKSHRRKSEGQCRELGSQDPRCHRMAAVGVPRFVEGTSKMCEFAIDWKAGVAVVDVSLGWSHTIAQRKCKVLARWLVIAMRCRNSPIDDSVKAERVLERIVCVFGLHVLNRRNASQRASYGVVHSDCMY
ncbi:hypothetical protein E2P81_ATG07344 [Venturia nashicola]|nr:hypothetical protein E2P81_ATG07344 [Venturia nashicola]